MPWLAAPGSEGAACVNRFPISKAHPAAECSRASSTGEAFELRSSTRARSTWATESRRPRLLEPASHVPWLSKTIELGPPTRAPRIAVGTGVSLIAGLPSLRLHVDASVGNGKCDCRTLEGIPT